MLSKKTAQKWKIKLSIEVSGFMHYPQYTIFTLDGKMTVFEIYRHNKLPVYHKDF